MSASAGRTVPAARLERNNDPLTGHQSRHPVAQLDDLAHHLVAHREWRGNRVEPEGDHRVKIAAGDSQWTHHCVAGVTQPRIRAFLPRQIARSAEHQMSHGSAASEQRNGAGI
jgi:hypothetical protein